MCEAAVKATDSPKEPFMTEIVIDPVLRHGPFPGRLQPARIAAYAAATGDDTAAVLAGRAVPVVFPVILAFAAQEAAIEDIPNAAWRLAHGGVHGEHDIVLHRPLIPNESLDTFSQICAVRTSRPGTRVVSHIQQFDAEGRLAVEQWWTTMLLGLHAMADLGATPPDHRFPDAARDTPIGSATEQIDEGITHRYAAVSGDWSAHHFDIEAARAGGFDFVFTHGLCTMAICAHRTLSLLRVGDPGLVRRIAARFASPMPLGADTTVTAYRINRQSCAFEATCRGATTISHGRMELRP
jgi:acyl dehydratase